MSEKISRRTFIQGGAAAITANTVESLQPSEAHAETINKIDYSRPVTRERLFYHEAKFEIFPEKINLKLNKKTFVVSRKWQIGAMYDEQGNLMYVDKKPFKIQVGTGELNPKRNTKLGLYQIDRKSLADYISKGTSDGEAKGASMPWAMHVGRYIRKGGKLELEYDGTAIHGRGTVYKKHIYPFRSHGCFGTEIENAKTLNQKMNKGDFILTLDDPELLTSGLSIDNLVDALNKEEENGTFLEEMKQLEDSRKKYPKKVLCWDGSEPDKNGLCPIDPRH